MGPYDNVTLPSELPNPLISKCFDSSYGESIFGDSIMFLYVLLRILPGIYKVHLDTNMNSKQW